MDEFEGAIGLPSVEEDELPVPVSVTVVLSMTVPVLVMRPGEEVDEVELAEALGLEEMPVGPGRLEVLLLPVTGATVVELPVPGKESVPERGRLEMGNGGKGP